MSQGFVRQVKSRIAGQQLLVPDTSARGLSVPIRNYPVAISPFRDQEETVHPTP